MPLKTNNIYGSITISDHAVSKIVSRVALECYGVVAITPSLFSYKVFGTGKKNKKNNRGLKVTTVDDKVYINLYVIISKGINQNAVLDSLHSLINYHVSNVTGMRVKDIKINVVGNI